MIPHREIRKIREGSAQEGQAKKANTNFEP
jgi:hypothetical protein